MERVSSFDAKTHLSKILAGVVSGKEYIITRCNKDVARLIPYRDSHKDIVSTIEFIKRNRLKSLSKEEILEYKNEGRK